MERKGESFPGRKEGKKESERKNSRTKENFLLVQRQKISLAAAEKGLM